MKPRERMPGTAALAVAGMPNGASGMEGPTSGPFSAVVFDEFGRPTVFESHRPPYRW